MMRVIVKLLKLFLSCLFIGLFIAVGYLFILVDDLGKSETFSLNRAKAEIKNTEIVIERDSFVLKSDLEFVFDYLENEQSYKKWIEDQKYFSNFSEQGKYLKFNTPQTFYITIGNSCLNPYCFQRKVDFSNIPSVLWRGLIGIEDLRFLDHKGIDFRSILRAAIADLKAGSFVQGGSTLTQQLVKNIFLNNEKSFFRKLEEMILSVYIEKNYSKEQILQSYFNEMFWGNLGGVRIKGIYAASKFYFKKELHELTDYESIILSSMLKGPNSYHPLKNVKKLVDRTNSLFVKLKKNKFLSNVDEVKWNDKTWSLWVEKLKKENLDTKYKSLAFALKEKEFYKNFIINDVSLKFLKGHREEDIAIKYYENVFRCGERFCDFNYYSKLEKDAISNLQVKLQVGSLLKPFVYQVFSKEGYEEDTITSTGPISFSLNSGVWKPRDRDFNSSEITMSDSLRKSRNIPMFHLIKRYGMDRMEKSLNSYLPMLKKPLREFPSQLLGSIELNFEEIYNGYKVFKNYECRGEKKIYSILNNPNQNTLSAVVKAQIQELDFFGKTGTSNNSLDNWFLTLDDEKIKILWVGLEGDRRGKKLELSGSRGAFKVFQDYVLRSGKKLRSLNCYSSGQKEEELDIN